MNKSSRGFTIVELLVVIVVIGILAAISMISYSGISEKAKIATIQSDLASAANAIEIAKTDNSSEDFPSTTNCAQADSSTNKCLKFSGDNTYTYTVSNTSNPKTFKLVVRNGNLAYYITNDNRTATAMTVPILSSPTSASIAATTATLGATVVSDGGDDMTGYGICWGTSPNPTTNCSEIEQGMLTALSPATTASAGSPIESVISPDGANLYAIGGGDGYIYQYSRSAATGLLAALSPSSITAGHTGLAIDISPDGKFVYVVSDEISNEADIHAFSRNTTTGKLTALSPEIYVILSTPPSDMKISADGKYIYVAYASSGSFYKYTRDINTGFITASSANFNNGNYGLSFDISPDGLYIYKCNPSSDDIKMYAVNSGNGNLSNLTPSFVSVGGSSYYPYGIVVSPDGKNVYNTNFSANNISMFTRNVSTGLLTILGAPSTISASGSSPHDITISPDGKSVYAAINGSSRIAMYFRDQSTGRLTALTTPWVTAASTDSLVVSPDGKYVYSSNSTNNSIGMFRRSVSVSLGVFTKPTTGLTTKVTYYYRGYATNSIGTGYSPDGTFTTL